jgi:hypothetical protein
MKELMYDIDVGLIAGILLISTVAALEVGYRVGLRISERTDERSRAHIHLTETATLSLLALLLAFTFSLSLQRYDSRSDQVVDEANAIGTAYLRIDLLPSTLRDPVRALMRDYVNHRVKSSTVATTHEREWRASVAETGRLQAALWSYAGRAAELDPSPVRSGMFIQALNEMIDSFGRRDAGLNRHVPEVVLMLLYGVFLITAAIVGFASGTGGHRPPAVSLVMVGLIVILVCVILDLDRPRRGLIEVSKKSLYDLQASIASPTAVPPAMAPPAGIAGPASGASR